MYFLLLPDILSALTISVDKNHANSAKAAYPPEPAQLLLSDEVQGPTPHRTRNTSGREKKPWAWGPSAKAADLLKALLQAHSTPVAQSTEPSPGSAGRSP